MNKIFPTLASLAAVTLIAACDPAPEAEVADTKPAESQPAESKPALEPIPNFADATVEKGAKVAARKCKGCHKFESGKAGGMGPNLWGVVGRPVGKSATFTRYSDAMAASQAVWDYAGLNTFLRQPQAFLPGTRMPFAGLKKAEDRANLILFLRSLSDHPVPLP